MIITKEFNRKVERDYFFIQGILNIDSQYFIQKIKESCASKDNNNYKTNIKGLMTPFEFFKQDQKFLTEIIIPVIDYVDENYKLNNYHILDAWGFEVRPKEKVGRPKVDPKKVKVIEPKFGYLPFKKKLDEAIKVSQKSLDDLTKKSKERLAKIEKELKDGTNRREIVSVKTDISTTKSSAGGGITFGDKINLVIKFGLNEGERFTRATRNKIPRATILPFEKPKK